MILCDHSIAGCFLIISICLWLQKTSMKITRDHIKYTVIFCIGQNIGSIMSFVSVELVPLSAVASLMCGSMMLCGVLLGAVILKERIEILHVISMLVCLIGLGLLISGSYMTFTDENPMYSCSQISQYEVKLLNMHGTESQNTSLGGGTHSNENITGLEQSNLVNASTIAADSHRNICISNIRELVIGLTLSCIAGVGEAVSLIGLKQVQSDIESVLVLSFWFTLSGAISSSIAMFSFEYTKLATPENLETGLYLLGHLGTSSLAMVCYVTAMGKLPSHMMSVFNAAQIPVTVVLQYAFFTQLQPIDSGLVEVVGACIVTVGLCIQPVFDAIIQAGAMIFPKTLGSSTAKHGESDPLLSLPDIYKLY